MKLPIRTAALVLVLGLWGGAEAAEAGRAYPPDIQAIKTRGTLRVALPSEDLPYFYCRNKDGRLEGHEVDLARSLADDLGVTLEFDRVATTYDEVVTRVREEKADLGICALSKTTSRSQQVLMSRPYLLVHPTVVVNRLRLAQLGDNVKGLAGLRMPGVDIAAQAGSSYVEYARSDFPNARVVPLDSLERCWEAVQKGTVLALYYDEIEIKSRFKRNPRLKIPLEIVGLDDVDDFLAVAIPPNRWSLLYYVNTYLDLNRPRVSTADEVMQKYRDPTLPVAAAAAGPTRQAPPDASEKWRVVGVASVCLALLLVWRRLRSRGRASAPASAVEALGGALLSPLAMLVAVVAGAIIGIYFRSLARALQPVGTLYMALLQMCVLPVILVTVMNSLGLLLREGGVKRVLTRLAAAAVLGALVVGCFGTLGSAVSGLGANLDVESKNVLGEFLSQHEAQFKESAPSAAEGTGFWGFVGRVVPANIFADLVSANTLSVLFFSTILGIALGVTSHGRNETFAVLESLFDAFSRIIAWLMYGLPVGMCCLVASMFAAVGIEIILGATHFIAFLYAGILLVMFLSSLVIWKRSHRSYAASLSALRRPLLIGLGNGRPVSAIPQAIESLVVELGFDRRATNLVVPLTFSTISFGNILYFSTSAIFLSRLYGAPLGLQQYAVIVVGSILAAVAAVNSPGLIALSMMGIVLGLLKLPLVPSLALLLAVDPLLDQPLALASVAGNCACAAFVAEPSASPRSSPGAVEAAFSPVGGGEPA